MMESVEAELCFPHLLNSSCRKPQTDITEAVLVYILLSLISLFTTTLNLLVIISISHFRQLHTSTNLILLSLAVSDFFIGFLVIPLEVLQWKSCWTLSDLLCVLYFILPITFVMASVGNIVLISVDRFVAISDPLRYPTRMNVKVVSFSVCVCWVYAVFYGIFILYDNFHNLGKYKSCQGECVLHISGDVDVVLAFILPFSTIVVLYMRVFVVAVSQARAVRSQVTAVTLQLSVTIHSRKSEIKAARNLGVVVLVYLMCYCPYFLVALSGGEILLGTPVEVVMIFLMFVNSFLNPIIYALFYPWFRKAMKIIVTLQILRPGSSDLMIL